MNKGIKIKLGHALSMALAVIMVCTSLSVSAFAATSSQTTRAKVLREIGLFQGYDKEGTNLGLDDQVTREQCLIFLIRMLGEETAAKNWKGQKPYTDVPNDSWAYNYIGYAKDKGYTVGVGDNKFGMGRTANMLEMTTFALRGLGYSDSVTIKDFDWSTVLSFAKSKGILESDELVTPFNRGVAVDIIFGAVTSNVKGESYTLLTKLMNNNVVTQEQYDKAMAILNGTPVKEK